jgi:hypothetical protein
VIERSHQVAHAGRHAAKHTARRLRVKRGPVAWSLYPTRLTVSFERLPAGRATPTLVAPADRNDNLPGTLGDGSVATLA